MSRSAPASAVRAGVGEAWGVLRSALRIRREPLAFCRRVAAGTVRYLDDRGTALAGASALDAGMGGGCVAEALAVAGARIVGLDVRDHRLAGVHRVPFVLGRGEALPFADGRFNLVVSSNVLEHVAETGRHVSELARVCRPGGRIYLSWTNWLSPLGGHEMSPFHYLGPRAAEAFYRRTRGRPPANAPGRSLFAVHVGDVLRVVRGLGLRVVDAAPRYWPGLRAISRVPWVREVLMWNCVLLLEPPLTRRPDASGPASSGGTPPGR